MSIRLIRKRIAVCFLDLSQLNGIFQEEIKKLKIGRLGDPIFFKLSNPQHPTPSISLFIQDGTRKAKKSTIQFVVNKFLSILGRA